MAKVTAPLLSMGARGQIGSSMVLAKWRGVDYARQYVKPANPQTEAQMANRTRFALLREMHKLAPAPLRDPWDAFAKGRPFTGVNKFVGENNRLLNGQTSMIAFLGSPGAAGGIPPEAVSAADAPAAGAITVQVTAPTQLPVGWSVYRVAAAAFVDQDPTGIFTGPLKAAIGNANSDTVTLDGFAAGDDLIAVGWVIYNKPDGSYAYSVSLSDAVTVA